MYCACVCARDKSRTVTRPIFITPRNFSCDKFRLVFIFVLFETSEWDEKNLHQKHLSNGWSKIKIHHTHTHTHAHGYAIYTGTRTNILAPV